MLVAAGVNHHVPGVAVQAVGPVVVTLWDDNAYILEYFHADMSLCFHLKENKAFPFGSGDEVSSPQGISKPV